jgi:hypothetical protein
MAEHPLTAGRTRRRGAASAFHPRAVLAREITKLLTFFDSADVLGHYDPECWGEDGTGEGSWAHAVSELGDAQRHTANWQANARPALELIARSAEAGTICACGADCLRVYVQCETVRQVLDPAARTVLLGPLEGPSHLGMTVTRALAA